MRPTTAAPLPHRAAVLDRGLAQLRPRCEGGDRVRVRWDADRFPLAVIRDAGTGEILSLAEGGEVLV